MKGLLVVLLACVVAAQAQFDFDSLIVRPLGDTLKDSLSQIFSDLLNAFKFNGQPMLGKRSLEEKFDQTKQTLDVFKVVVNEQLKDVLKQFSNQLKSLYPKFLLDFVNGKREIEDITKQVQAQLQGLFQNSLNHLQDILKQIATQSINKVIEYVTKKPNGEAKREVVNKFQQAFQQIIQALQGHVQNVGQTLVDHGKNVVDNLKPHYDDLKEQLVGHGLNAAQSVLEALKNSSQQLTQG